MNILQPELIWIDGRCYRLFGNIERPSAQNISPYFEDNYQMDYKDSEDECDIEIVPYESTRFKHIFHVSKYIKCVI